MIIRTYEYNLSASMPQKINFFCSAEGRIWHLSILFLYFHWIGFEELAGGEVGFEVFVPAPGVCDAGTNNFFQLIFLLHGGDGLSPFPFFIACPLAHLPLK